MTRKRFGIAAAGDPGAGGRRAARRDLLRPGRNEPGVGAAFSDVAADQALAGFSLGDTEGLVQQLQDVVRENPRGHEVAQPARPRLPAARPRDRRSDLLHEVRGRPRPGTCARAARPPGDERPRLARARASRVSRRALARPEGHGDLARHGSQLRRRGRCARRARPLRGGVHRLRSAGRAEAGAGRLLPRLLRA